MKDENLILTSEQDLRVIAYIDAVFEMHSNGWSHSGATVFVGDEYFCVRVHQLIAIN